MRLLLPLLLILPTAALAETYEVKMLNRNMTGPMVYEPDHLSIAPGDTVKFLATDKGHNAAVIEGMLLDGAAVLKGNINEGRNEARKMSLEARSVHGTRGRAQSGPHRCHQGAGA